MTQQQWDPEAIREIEELRARLEEAEETLRAIQSGEVDALVVSGPQGNQIYTLKGAESTYRVLVEAMNEGALVLTPDGTVMYSNSAFADMLNVHLEQVIGSRIHRFVHGSDLDAVDKLLNEGMRTDTKCEIALQRDSDGTVVPAQISVGNLPTDEAPGMAAVVTDLTEHKRTDAELQLYREHLEDLVSQRTQQLQDITEELESANEELQSVTDHLVSANEQLHREIDERKTVEEALRQSEARFRAVFESTQDAIVLADDKGIYTEANPAVESVFGVTPEQLRGRSICDFMENCEDSDTVWAEFLQRGSATAQLRLVQPDGSVKEVEGHSVANILPGRHLSVLHDITDRVRYERELAEARSEAERRAAQLRAFVYSMADGVVLFDAQRRVLLANEMLKTLLGTPPEVAYKDWIKHYYLCTLDGKPIPEEDYPSYRALMGEETRDARFRMVSPWKESLVSISGSPVRDADGTVIGGSISFRDVSGLVEFERRQNELFQREHNIAQMLQQALIPPQVDYDVAGVKIAVHYQPAMSEADIGGDFYDVIMLGDNRVGILVGDVAGKGLQAAIRVAAARYAVRSYAYLDSSPGVVLTLVNEALCKDEPSGSAMLTAFFAIVDANEGTLTYASAGHEPGLLRDVEGEISQLGNGGRVLGVLPGFTYTEVSLELRPDQKLVVVTDGITEARHDGMLFGVEGVKELVASSGELTPRETASRLLEAAMAHAGGALQDDAAIVVVELEQEDRAYRARHLENGTKADRQ